MIEPPQYSSHRLLKYPSFISHIPRNSKWLAGAPSSMASRLAWRGGPTSPSGASASNSAREGSKGPKRKPKASKRGSTPKGRNKGGRKPDPGAWWWSSSFYAIKVIQTSGSTVAPPAGRSSNFRAVGKAR